MNECGRDFACVSDTQSFMLGIGDSTSDGCSSGERIDATVECVGSGGFLHFQFFFFSCSADSTHLRYPDSFYFDIQRKCKTGSLSVLLNLHATHVVPIVPLPILAMHPIARKLTRLELIYVDLD